MNYKSFIRKLSLTETDMKDIKDCVEKVEKNTNGEIALAVTAESSSYAYWELLVSFLSSAALFLLMLPQANQVYKWFGDVFWDVNPWYLTAFYFLICLVMTGVLYALFNIPALDSVIIPEKAKATAVTNRSVRYFAESGVYCTKDHSGILIFVSFFEKQVRIVADKGISEKIGQDLWDLIADEMAENLSKGNVKDAYLSAINRCGDLLSEYFPAKEENPNELNDGLVILENEAWV